MASKSGLPSTIIKFTIPSTASAAAFTNGGVAIGSLKAGRYLCVLSYAIDPVNGLANIATSTAIVTSTALVGAGTAVGLIQLQSSAGAVADANGRFSACSIVTLAADAPIFLSISATTSAGNFIGSTVTQDSLSNSISFILLQ